MNDTTNKINQEQTNKSAVNTDTNLKPGKIIDRLDDISLQSEAEATKVVDLIDETANHLNSINKITKEFKELLKLKKLTSDKSIELLDKIDVVAKESQEKLFDAMNLLQYQDVLRQKIEKITAALSSFHEYLGQFLGRGKKKPEERVTGKHIEDAVLSRDQKVNEIKEIIKKG